MCVCVFTASLLDNVKEIEIVDEDKAATHNKPSRAQRSAKERFATWVREQHTKYDEEVRVCACVYVERVDELTLFLTCSGLGWVASDSAVQFACSELLTSRYDANAKCYKCRFKKVKVLGQQAREIVAGNIVEIKRVRTKPAVSARHHFRARAISTKTLFVLPNARLHVV